MARFDMFNNFEEITEMYDGGVFRFKEWGDTYMTYNPSIKMFVVFSDGEKVSELTFEEADKTISEYYRG